MTTTINLTDLTNDDVTNQEWIGTGVFDVLIAATNRNIETQFQKGRITGNDYAQVYLGGMQVVLQQSVEFLLRKDLISVQIAIAEKELEIKEKELELRTTEANRLKDTTEAELEKQWGYDVTRDVNGELVLGISTGKGAIDEDIKLRKQQTNTTFTEQVLKDKQAAILGLDNVVKQSEALRTTNSAFVYTPNYKS